MTRRFCAFISYRHADNTHEGRRWAEWLHTALERYVVPPDLVGTENLRGEAVRDSLYPIFRDEKELPAHPDLSAGISEALEASDFLIVICSPRSAVSPWVRKEVREFKDLGRSGRILPIIIAGEPNADDPRKVREGVTPDEECFCEELRFGVAREDGSIDWSVRADPLAGDLRPNGMRAEGFVTAEAYREYLTHNSSHAPERIAALTEAYRQRLDQGLFKVIAGLLGVAPGVLVNRDAAHRAEVARKELARAETEAARLRHLNRRLAVVGVVALVLAVLAGVYWWRAGVERNAAVVALDEAKVQRGIAQRNGVNLLAAKDEQQKLLHEASMADYATAVQRIEKDGKWHEGIALLARALKWEPGNALAALRLYSTLSFYAAEEQSWPRQVLSHEADVVSARYSPNGTLIVTASRDHTAQVWDVASGRKLGEPLLHEDDVNSAEFSPDGTRIVTASRDETARVWDAATGRPLGMPLRHQLVVRSAEFSPDGTRIVTASDDEIAQVWEAATGRALGEPLRHEGRVNAAHFSPDGTRIVTASDDETAQVWEAATGKALGERLRHEGRVNAAHFSPDGTRIVTASDDTSACVWDAASGRALRQPLSHSASVTQALFSPAGTHILTTSVDQSAQLWDVTTSELLVWTMKHDGWVNSAQFSPDGKRILTASGALAWIWDEASGEVLRWPLLHASRVNSAQFSPDGTHIVTAGADGTAQVGDASGRKFTGEPLCPKDGVRSAHFSPDGKRIVTTGEEGAAQVWDAASGRALGDPLEQESGAASAHFSADGTRVLTVSDDQIARVWTPPGNGTGKALSAPRILKNAGYALQFSADGARLLSFIKEDAIQVWDTASGKALGEPLPCKGVYAVLFSPDGTRLLTQSLDGTHQMWEVAGGKAVGAPMHSEVGRGVIKDAQFSADGTRLLIFDEDAAQVWDLASGKPLGEPLQHEGKISSAQFSRDGTRIVTLSLSDARIWDAASGRVLGGPFYCETAVIAQFSPDGIRILTTGYDQRARVWDVASGKALGEPLYHEGLHSAEFSRDGTRILTTGGDKTARVWDISPLDSPLVPVPAWMRARAVAIAGLEFEEDGELRSIAPDVRREMILAAPPTNDPWSKIARWLAAPANVRTITPDSRLNSRQMAERERDAGTLERLESALRHDPTTPLVHVLLAAVQVQKDAQMDPAETSSASLPPSAAFLDRYGLKLLPDDASQWARASESLVEQGQVQAAMDAARKALSIDSSAIGGQRALVKVLVGSDKRQGALEAYDKVLGHADANVMDFSTAGLLAAQLGSSEKALNVFRSAEAKFPTDPQIPLIKAFALLILKSPTEALQVLKSCEKGVADPGIHSLEEVFHTCRALALWLSGDKDAAVTEYLKLIEIAPENASPDSATQGTEFAQLQQPLAEVRTETLRRHPERKFDPEATRPPGYPNSPSPLPPTPPPPPAGFRFK